MKYFEHEHAGSFEEASELLQSGHSGQFGQSGLSAKAGLSGQSAQAGQSAQTGQSAQAGLSGQSGLSGLSAQAAPSAQAGQAVLSELSAQAWQAVQAGQAAQAVHSGQSGKKAVIMAGGTDLLGVLKDDILPDYPKMVVDIKTIPHDNPISINNGTLSISALTKLKDAAESETVKKYAPALAEAIKTVATPLVRNLGTVGGNICQDVRCWFYRYPHEGGGRMLCSRKGGDVCYALQGDNRYHSVFGGMKAHVTPCIQKCPAATDIPGYMEQIRKGNLEGAAHMIMKVNPMPMITARVCAHFCHDACNRACTDENVNIGGVERALGDYIIEYSEFFFAPPEELTGKSIAVIGSGPSGLAAAYYQRKAGNEVTVFDNMPEAGGMLMYTIPAYRLPKDLVRKYIAILEKMGVKFECNTQIGKDVAPTELEQKFDSVFYATGAWKRPVIGIAGEELTEFGLDFLIEVNKWMKGKIGTEVLVTGGGNVAMDVAITAKRLGARKVTMACLEPLDRMPASSEEIARAKEEGVVIMPSWGLVGVVEEGGAVKGMELKRCTSVWDEKGVFDPQYDDSERIVVNAESILMAVGQQVDLSFLDEKYQIQLNKRGLIDVVEDTGMTSRPGVFAGGDAITGPATVIDSIATGHRASNGMLRYLGLRGAAGSGSAGAAGAGAAGTGSAGAVGAGADAGVGGSGSAGTAGASAAGTVDKAGAGEPHSKFITFDVNAIERRESIKQRELPVSERAMDKEDSFTLDMEQVATEAGRCMNCGCYAVNPSDIAPVLVALNAEIITNKRRISAEEFCCDFLKVSEQLKPGEIVEKIDIPFIEGATMHYDKFRLRESVDFAIASAATVYKVKEGKISGAKIVLGGVAPVPLDAKEAGDFLVGKAPSGQVADEAAELAVKSAFPMSGNSYKLVELKVLLKKSIMRLV